MKIGIVTVTYNSASVLTDFLSSIKSQDYTNYCLYVVDNDSQDSTFSILKSSPLENKFLIKNDQNVGVAQANNQAIELALNDNCDFVLLINNDTLFEATLLTKLVDAYHKYGSSIIVPKMKFYDSNEIWYAGGFFNRKKAYLNYHVGQGQDDMGQFDEDAIVEYAPICCSLVHRSVFNDIGLMDEKYFVYWDDADFFFRIMKDERHEVRYVHDFSFYHKIGSLTKSRVGKSENWYGRFFIEQMTKNHVYFLRKQGSLFFYLQIIYLWFYVTLRFFVSKNFEKKIHVLMKSRL